MLRMRAINEQNSSSLGLLFWCHVLDEIVDILVHLSIRIRRDYERVAFNLQDLRRAFDRWVNQGNYFEAGSEFAVVDSGLGYGRQEKAHGGDILFKTKRVVPRPYEKWCKQNKKDKI